MPLRLQESEILTIALSSDIDGTGRIDYQEFMKYFKDCLFWVKLNNEQVLEPQEADRTPQN